MSQKVKKWWQSERVTIYCDTVLSLDGVISLIVSLLFACGAAGIHLDFKNLWTHLASQAWIFLFSTVMGFVLLSIPMYMIRRLKVHEEKLTEFEKSVDEKMSKVAKFVGLYSVDNLFEKRINSLDNRSFKPSHHWIYAKYTSELLSKSFSDFSINGIDPTAYSKFSAALIKEATGEICLTSTIRLSDWLANLLADQTQKFFNNIGKITNYKLLEDNHSNQLQKRSSGKSYRCALITSYDHKYLFISERSLDAYNYHNNSGNLQTTFYILPEPDNVQKNNDLNTDYVLYDDKILLEWNIEDKKLSIYEESMDNTAITQFKERFKNFTSNTNDGYKTYIDLKKEICEEKKAYLDTINNTKKLPHKLSYLYSGGEIWKKYIDNSNIQLGSRAIQSLDEGLTDFWNKIKQKNNDGTTFNIVEIGPGTGNHIPIVCDHFGTNTIGSYTLIDISRTLLDQAYEILKQRLPNNAVDKKSHPLDCCEAPCQADIRRIVKKKHVLIPNNGTLFMEDGFDIQIFAGALDIFVTLDKYRDGQSYEDHIEAEAILSLLETLKIFEIPIDEKILTSFVPQLFGWDYTDKKGYGYEYHYEIFFNLKNYIAMLQGNINDSDESNGGPSKNNELSKSKIDDFKDYYKPEEILEKPLCRKEDLGDDEKKYDEYLKLYEQYCNNRDELFKQEKLIILTSLKFKNTDNAKNYFEREGFAVQCTETQSDFIALLLTQQSIQPTIG